MLILLINFDNYSTNIEAQLEHFCSTSFSHLSEPLCAISSLFKFALTAQSFISYFLAIKCYLCMNMHAVTLHAAVVKLRDISILFLSA